MIVFGPILLALFFAVLQWVTYMGLEKVGMVAERPFFGLLLFRGLVAVLALAVIAALLTHYTDLGIGFEVWGNTEGN